MAWSSPKTWASGEVLTAAALNMHVRDQLRYLKGLDGPVQIDNNVTVRSADTTRLTVQSTGTTTYPGVEIAGNSRVYELTVGGSAAGGFANRFCIYDRMGGAARLVIMPTGTVGFGTLTPAGRVHAAGMSGGGMVFWDANNVGASPVEIVPAGTVTQGIVISGIFRRSDGGVSHLVPSTSTRPGNTSSFFADGGTTNTFSVTVYANGQAVIFRSGGTLTYQFALQVVYL